MIKLNELFPATNLVSCVFAFRQNTNETGPFNKYDCLPDAALVKAKRYMYRVPERLRGELKVGDAVVVHCRTGFQLARVTELNVISSYPEASFAPVVCKADLHSYFDEIDTREALQAMRNKIEAEKKRLESMVTYDLIAEKNPDFKALLDAYRAAGGEF